MSAVQMTRASEKVADEEWLAAFRRGDRKILEESYRQYYRVVELAIGNILASVDRETVIHEVFFRLLTEPEMRESFAGPSLGAWLSAIARNRALDVSRRARREDLVAQPMDRAPGAAPPAIEEDAIMRMLLERFQREHIPSAWAPVFEARFLREMTQREAALHLGMRRTTLAYQELQLRRRLRRFMLETQA